MDDTNLIDDSDVDNNDDDAIDQEDSEAENGDDENSVVVEIIRRARSPGNFVYMLVSSAMLFGMIEYRFDYRSSLTSDVDPTDYTLYYD